MYFAPKLFSIQCFIGQPLYFLWQTEGIFTELEWYDLFSGPCENFYLSVLGFLEEVGKRGFQVIVTVGQLTENG